MSFPKVKIPPCGKWEGTWSLWVNKSEGLKLGVCVGGVWSGACCLGDSPLKKSGFRDYISFIFTSLFVSIMARRIRFGISLL